jgi:hypothetical protein
MVLVADGDRATARGRAAGRQSALTIASELDYGRAAAADDAGLAGDLLFVEADADGGAAYDALLDRMARAAQGGQAVIVAIVPELIDATVARLGDAPVTILCTNDGAERTATVAMALARGVGGVRQDDGAGGDGLRAIGEDLARIATRLMGLAERRAPLAAPALPEHDATMKVTAADYRRLLRARRLRDLYLGEGLFADPAWDMLLDLMAARLEGTPVAVSSLCIAAAVPPTTALRWIGILTERGMLARIPDQQDGRRVFVTLSDATAAAMTAYMCAAKALERA